MENIRSIWLLIVYFHFITKSGGLNPKIMIDKFKIYNEIMMEILTLCHQDYKNLVIYDNGDTNGVNFSTTEIINSYVIINSSTQNDKLLRATRKSKIDAFFIITHYENEFFNMATVLKQTQWWDTLTPFYIFSKSDQSCVGRKNLFRFGWDTMNILSLIFTCVTEKENVPLVFTYNPYATYAPRPWQLLSLYTKPNDSFRVFNRMYQSGKLCRGLNFDRTKVLNNTIVKFGKEFDDTRHKIAKHEQWKRFFSEGILNMFYGDSRIFSLFKKSLNVKYQTALVGVSTKKNIGTEELANKATQLKIDLIFITEMTMPNYSTSYPYKMVDYTIVSPYRGRRNLFEQIYYIFGPWMLVVLGILILITFGVIWCSNRRKSASFAFLEIIRLLIDSGLEIRMDTPSLKIFFMMIFLYFLIVQTLFQGELATFFTNPPHRTLAQSMEDLESSKYSTIFVIDHIAEFLRQHEKLDKKVTGIEDSLSCLTSLNNDIQSACIITNSHANWFRLRQMPVHVSSTIVHKTYEHVWIREDSPLKNRINEVFLRLWELGFSSLITEEENTVFSGFLTRQRTQKKKNWSKINSRSLIPMFIFLAIGLLCSTVCFMFELIIYHRKKIVKIISEWMNTFQLRQNFRNERKKKFWNKYC